MVFLAKLVGHVRRDDFLGLTKNRYVRNLERFTVVEGTFALFLEEYLVNTTTKHTLPIFFLTLDFE